MSTVVLPATPARTGGAARATRWWGKAWGRAVEEAAYAERDLLAARTLARSGRIGRISVEPGRFVAAVEDAHGLWAVVGTLPVLDDAGRQALVETIAAEAGRVTALLAGDLPFDLAEHAEEAGAELLPTGGELGSECTCRAWSDPCVHALAVLHQLGWRVEADPLVLLHLRGLPREDLLARLRERAPADPGPVTEPADGDDVDLDLAEDAARAAARLLREGRATGQ